MDEEESKEKEGKVEKIAGNENKDKNSLAYDQKDYRLIDIDDILKGDYKVARKINNLGRFGVRAEQVKKIYEMNNSATGKNLEEILKNLENVFVNLAKKISSDPKIGIVIDLNTGRENVTLSRIKCRNLGKDYETFETKRPEEKISMMELIYREINKDINNDSRTTQSKIELKNRDKYYYTRSFLDNYPYKYEAFDKKELAKLHKELGISEEDIKRFEEAERMVHIETLNDLNTMRAIYNYRSIREGNKSKREIERAEKILLEELEKHAPSKWHHILFDKEEKKFDINMAVVYSKVWQDNKNMVDLKNGLQNALRIEGNEFEKIPIKMKEKVVELLAKSLNYIPEDEKAEYIIRLRDKLADKFNIKDISKESIGDLIYQVHGIKINDNEDLQKFIAMHEMNINRSNVKFNRIEETLNDTDNIKKSYAELTNVFITSNMQKTAEKADIFKLLTKSNLPKEFEKDYKVFEIISLYKEFYYDKDNEDSQKNKNFIEEYILENKVYFEQFFKEQGIEGIFSKNGAKVNITNIKKILNGKMLPEEVVEDIQRIKQEIKDINEITKSEKIKSRKKVISLERLLDQEKELTAVQEKRILKLLEEIEVGAIDEGLLEKLNAVNSDAVKSKIEEKFHISQEDIRLIPRHMEYKSREEILEENILLLEAKLEYFKGTPEYSVLLEEKIKYLKTHEESNIRDRQIRDENGELTESGRNDLSSYINRLLLQTIKYNINKTNVRNLNDEEKKNFTAIIIAGMSEDNLSSNYYSMDVLQKLYPELESKKNIDELKEAAYGIIYGEDIANNPDKLKAKKVEARKNLIKKILNKKEIIDVNELINDKEIQGLMAIKGVDLEVDQIDVGKSRIQNQFANSQISFTDEDNRAYEQYYKESTLNSWIESKEEAQEQEIASVLLTIDYFDKNPNNKPIHKSLNRENYNRKLDFLLERNPEIKEKYFKDGNLMSEELLEKGKEFSRDTITSILLDKFKNEILVKAKDYDELSKFDKASILRYSITATKIAEETQDEKLKGLLEKLAYRAFELMSSDEKSFISFDENGKGILNEENILHEANLSSMKMSQAATFEEMRQMCAVRHNLLTVACVTHQYSQLEDTDFLRLEDIEGEDKLEQLAMFRIKKREEIQARKELAKLEQKNKKEKDSEKNQEPKIENIETSEEKQEPKTENIEVSETTPELKAEDIEVSQKNSEPQNEKKGFINMIKTAFSKMRQPRLTDGTVSQENKKSLGSKIVDGFKKIFAKKEEKIDNITTKVEQGNSQSEYTNSNNAFDKYVIVSDYQHPTSVSIRGDNQHEGKTGEQSHQEDIQEDISL